MEALIYLGVVLGLVFALILFGLYLYRLLCFAHTAGLRCLDGKPTASVSGRGGAAGRTFDSAANARNSSNFTSQSKKQRDEQGAESVRLLKSNNGTDRRFEAENSSESEVEFRQPTSQDVRCQNVDESTGLFLSTDAESTEQQVVKPKSKPGIASHKDAQSANVAILDTSSNQEAGADPGASAAWIEISLKHRCNREQSDGTLEIVVLRAAGILTVSTDHGQHRVSFDQADETAGGDPASAQIIASLTVADTDDEFGRRLRTKTVGIGASAGGVSVFGDLLTFEGVSCSALQSLSLRLRLYTCQCLGARRRLLAAASLTPPAMQLAAACQLTMQPMSAWQPSCSSSAAAASQDETAATVRLPLLPPTFELSAGGSDTGFSEISSLAGPSGNGVGREAASFNTAALGDATDSLSSLMGQAELFLGLTYNSLTGQLGIEVLKGSGLRPQKSTGRPPDTLVKLCLESASSGQPMFRSKTSCATGTPHPMWKDNFVFPVNKFLLVDVTVFACVYARKPILSRLELVGWVALGRKSSGEEERSHWQDMLDAGGSQTCRWHRLLTPGAYSGPKP